MEERRKSYDDMGWIKTALKVVGSALLVHFVAGIWWAATLTERVGSLGNQMVDVKAQIIASNSNNYRISDSVKDFNAVYERIKRQDERLVNLERRPHGDNG